MRARRPRGANLGNRFPPSAFLYQPERNRCICPEGKVLLPQARRKVGAGTTYRLYQARLEDCRSGPRNPECYPDNKKNGRSVAQLEERAAVMAFRKQMSSQEVQERYRRRERFVGFCHVWIKSKRVLGQFHVRGLAKVQMEMPWACLTYNLQQRRKCQYSNGRPLSFECLAQFHLLEVIAKENHGAKDDSNDQIKQQSGLCEFWK